MGACIQSESLSGPCVTCGRRAKKMHRPLFHRGSFCPRCCPVCAAKAAPAAAAPPESRGRSRAPYSGRMLDGGHAAMPADDMSIRVIAMNGVSLRPGYLGGQIGSSKSVLRHRLLRRFRLRSSGMRHRGRSDSPSLRAWPIIAFLSIKLLPKSGLDLTVPPKEVIHTAQTFGTVASAIYAAGQIAAVIAAIIAGLRRTLDVPHPWT